MEDQSLLIANDPEESVIFNCLAVGNEVSKLKNIVLYYVENSTAKQLFSSVSKNRYIDDLVCVEACVVLKALQGEPIEQESCCLGMVNLLITEKNNLIELDKIITKIIFTAFKEGIISLLLACQLLVTSIDFKMTIPLNPEKIQFVRERMHQLDYKNMRDLLKLLLVEKLDKMQCVLTENQHKQLMHIEELMIDLIDRKKNFCPALFFITEISRIQPNSSVHFLPRVSLKIREMVASFRPLAEIGSMVGRSWMYPITTQVGFNWAYSTWATWKLQEQNYRLYFKTHLPYSNENMAPQTYLQYILLKQPRGQENLTHMLKPSSSHMSGSPSRLQCSEVVQILILEAMCAMEDSEHLVLTPINQYNWMHLCHLMMHALSIGCCTLHQLLPMLQLQLKNCHYHKAKAELMWILLQFIATAKSKSTSQTFAKNQLDAKNRDLVLDIFNVLYPDEMVWVGCSTDCLNMVRFFAPASLWINLSYYQNSSVNVMPPQKVHQHIEFLKSQLESGIVLENGVLAVIANAYSNNLEIFETHVSRAILKMLGAVTDSLQHQSFSNVQQWTLPHGRKSDGCVAALDLSLLDSFTFHAKKMLYQSLTSYLQSHTQNGFLPSPALIETLSRIILTMEMGDGRAFILFFIQICKENQNTDLIGICAELLNLRLQDLQLAVQNRAQFLLCAFEALCAFSLSSSSQHRALYTKMEQIIMRQLIIASPLDLASIAYSLFSCRATSGNTPLVNLFVNSEAYAHSDYRQHGLHACPEISRMFLLNLFRAHKVLSTSSISIISDLVFDYILPTRQCYKWSNSAIKWFPSVAQGAIDIEDAPSPALIQELQNVSDREYRFLMNGNDEYFLPNYQQITLLISVFKCIYELSNFPPYAYKVLATLSAKDLILNTNAFVDYIIWRSQNLDSQGSDHYERLVLVVNEMIFVHNCIPIDRFLLALIIHPNDDTSIEYALLLLSTLIQKFNHLLQRIHNYCGFAFFHSNVAYAKSEDFFTKLSEYYKKYPEFTYLEMLKMTMSSEKFTESEKHLPIYYDNMPERILPIVDILLQRSLEIAVNPQILTTFLTTFSPLYKFHPQPLTFLYKTMYSLDSLGTFSHTPVARQFVMEIVQKIDDDRNPKFIVLSQEFVVNDHKMHVVKFCQALVDRIIAASTYIHQPPSFVVRDWRFSEYPPAAQALTGAWIELLASPHDAKDITEGIVELAMQRPIHRPNDSINAISLLLTGLPSSFQNVFFNKIVDSFDWSQLVDGEPSMLFETFSQEVYLYSEDRILSMLALIHSFCQHAGNNSLSVLPDLLADRLAPKVQNETQLLYFLRILVPYLQRISDKEKQRHMNEYLKLIISIYNVLGTLVEKIGQLKYEDTVCDLLYQFKYMFVGYSLKNEAEKAIEKFPKSMREKLKFLLTHSSSAEQQIVLGQQHHHQQQLAAGAMSQHQIASSVLAVASSSAGSNSFVPHHSNAHILQQLAAAGMISNMGMPLQSQQNVGVNLSVQNTLMPGSVTLTTCPKQTFMARNTETNSNNIPPQNLSLTTTLTMSMPSRFPQTSMSMASSQQHAGLPPPPPYSQNGGTQPSTTLQGSFMPIMNPAMRSNLITGSGTIVGRSTSATELSMGVIEKESLSLLAGEGNGENLNSLMTQQLQQSTNHIVTSVSGTGSGGIMISGMHSIGSNMASMNNSGGGSFSMGSHFNAGANPMFMHHLGNISSDANMIGATSHMQSHSSGMIQQHHKTDPAAAFQAAQIARQQQHLDVIKQRPQMGYFDDSDNSASGMPPMM